MRGIIDAFGNPLVEQITMVMPTQIGKTEGMLNMMGYAIDQDPGPALYVTAREPDAKSISTDRVQPMIRLTPALIRHTTGNPDHITDLKIRLDSMIVYFAGSNSPAALASKPIRYLFLDETNKYPPFSGEESDPIKLATERTRTFWNRKIVAASTPTVADGYINREYERSDQRLYYVPCPFCGGYQVLGLDQIKVPESERDPKRIKDHKIAWYECFYCKKKIVDMQKQGMLLRGVWLPANVKVDRRGSIPDDSNNQQSSHVGFHLNAIYSPWLTFSEVIAEFFSCKDRPELLMNFVNSWLAQVWQIRGYETKPEHLKKLCQDYKKAQVPDGAIILTAGVDVQKNFFVCTIRAWGAYPRSWLVTEEVVNTWDDVKKLIIDNRYVSVRDDLPPFAVSLSCIDTGYRTAEAYDFCRTYRNCTRAIKGKDTLGGIPFRTSIIDKKPTGETIPGGLALFLINTTYFKDKISSWVRPVDDTLRFFIYNGVSENYLRWFCGEHKVPVKDKKRRTINEVWRKVSSHAQCHSWDAEVYAAAAAEMLYVYNLRDEDQPKPAVSREQREEAGRTNTWLQKRTGWLSGRT